MTAKKQKEFTEVKLTPQQQTRLGEIADRMNVARASADAAVNAAVMAETDLWREVQVITGDVNQYTYTLKNMGLGRPTLWRSPLIPNRAK